MIRLPSGKYAMDVGVAKFELDPNSKSRAPLGCNTCTRALFVSATAILVPSGDHAAARGLSKCPGAAP